jgi:hypothetical protein
VLLVAAVSTDRAGIVIGDIRAVAGPQDVRSAFGTGRLLEVGWPRPFVLDLQSVIVRCRVGPDTVGLPELADTGETVAHGLPDGDVIGVATALVQAVILRAKITFNSSYEVSMRTVETSPSSASAKISVVKPQSFYGGYSTYLQSIFYQI